jgi:two-component sensor histidine kinase
MSGGCTSVRWSENFEPDLGSLKGAREFVSDKVSAASVDMDVLVLLTSELVTNAVAHAHTPYSVVVDSAPTTIRIEVWDSDPHTPKVSAPSVYAEKGRGMMLVTVLAKAWGVDQQQNGKSVWFELAVNAQVSARAAKSPRVRNAVGRPAA